MEAGSPWSTPTESELGAAEADFKNKELFDEIDFKVNESFVRELGDGEPSLDANVELGILDSRNDALLPPNMDEEEAPESNVSSPTKRKGRKVGPKGSPKKRSPVPPKNSPKKKAGPPRARSRIENDEEEVKTSPSKTRARSESPKKLVSPKKRNNTKLKHQPLSVQKPHPPTAGSATSGDSGGSLKLGADFEDEGTNGTFSATTVRTASTANTDFTNSSGSSGGGVGGGVGSGSPRRSPTKSPRKKARARDVLTLPKPYNNLKSDVLRKWLKELNAGNQVDIEVYPNFKQIRFSNALILKTNQLLKQVIKTPTQL